MITQVQGQRSFGSRVEIKIPGSTFGLSLEGFQRLQSFFHSVRLEVCCNLEEKLCSKFNASIPGSTNSKVSNLEDTQISMNQESHPRYLTQSRLHTNPMSGRTWKYWDSFIHQDMTAHCIITLNIFYFLFFIFEQIPHINQYSQQDSDFFPTQSIKD